MRTASVAFARRSGQCLVAEAVRETAAARDQEGPPEAASRDTI
jgi:hypothetical protein